tara:strand:- start:188 stop:361 length:174 start_codon:yes stop_codon:yes gene_type:complete
MRDAIIKEVKTRDELMASAERWVVKGVKLEAEGKSKKMIDMCIDKAIGFENEALAIK